MNSSQRALQTNGILFSNFDFFLIFGRKPKKNSKELLGVNIDQIAMRYICICVYIYIYIYI